MAAINVINVGAEPPVTPRKEGWTCSNRRWEESAVQKTENDDDPETSQCNEGGNIQNSGRTKTKEGFCFHSMDFEERLGETEG